MPNHITNILVVDNAEILDFIKNEKGDVDFEVITPMPDYIRNTSCGVDVCYEDNSVKDYQERAKTRRPLTKEEIALGANQGWYDWSKINWGTKWNAYETNQITYDILSFQTAWNPPIPVLLKLSLTFPQDKIFLYCKDEGREGGFDEIIFKDGKIIHAKETKS